MRAVFALLLPVVLPVAQPPVWPVTGTIVRGFVAPSCPRCAGHRGVDIRVTPGEPVRAVADGVVMFAGPVARRLYVVVRIASGALVTYGWLAEVDTALQEGDAVVRGQRLGRTGEIFYLGVRDRGRPVEPLGALGFRRPRLVGPGWVQHSTVAASPPAR